MGKTILFAIPTRNSGNNLRNLIESLKMQSSFDWKILFIDGSTLLEEKKLIKQLCAGEKRCFLINENPNTKGIYSAMNEAFSFVKDNEWLIFWGSDDWASSKDIVKVIIEEIDKSIKKNIYPDLLIFSANYFSQQKNLIGRKTFFYSKSKIIYGKEFRRALFLGLQPPHQTVVFSPKIILKKSYYSTKYVLASDLDYFLKLSKNHLIIKSIPKRIVFLGDEGISSKKHLLRITEVCKCYFDCFGILFFIPLVCRYLRKICNIRFVK